MTDEDIRKKTVAIIPAKAHSRRVPGKNLRPFHGRPLVSYAVREAKKSALIDVVYVSTESPDIEACVTELGAIVPFRRPMDQTTPEVHSTVPVLDLIEREQLAERYEFCLKLLPPYPLRTVKAIDEIIRLAWERKQNVLSIGSTGLTMPHLRTRDETGHIHSLMEKPVYNFQAQDNPILHFISGFAQCAPIRDILRERTFQYGTPVGYVVDKLEISDIDTEEDFRFLETIYPTIRNT